MKKIAIIFLSMTFTIAAFSQQMREKIEEKVKIQRIAFITQRLSLTETEAQQFWPIFNEFTDKMQQIRKQPKPEKPFDEQADADVEKMIDQVTLIGVDRQKKTFSHLSDALNIVNVPTIIVMKNGKEIGRVVEYGKYGLFDQELGEILGTLK